MVPLHSPPYMEGSPPFPSLIGGVPLHSPPQLEGEGFPSPLHSPPVYMSCPYRIYELYPPMKA